MSLGRFHRPSLRSGRIDELHLDYPFAGSRMLRDLLRGEGVVIGRGNGRHADAADGDRGDLSQAKHIDGGAGTQNRPVFAARAPSKSSRSEPRFWATRGITYIPMARGFVYLAAVVDWFTGEFCRGGCRSRWTSISASKPLRRRSPARASLFSLLHLLQYEAAALKS